MISANSVFLSFTGGGIVLFYFWWKTTHALSTNDVMLQGVDILAGLVLSLSFAMMVFEQNKANAVEKNQRVLLLTQMNREYWLKLMELFMKHSHELRFLTDEIFLGVEYDEKETKGKPQECKQMEFYVIEHIFQMLSDVYRVYDINYLPRSEITGWSNTFALLFSSKTVRAQWKHSRFLYGNSRVHDFVEEHGIIDRPKLKLLEEMRKSHMVTMIRNKKLANADFKEKTGSNQFKDISKEDNASNYVNLKYTL